jgi:hypothetical protein
MEVDIAGRVRNLPLPVTQPLIPVFECLVNSIESLEESDPAAPRIDVHIERDTRQTTLGLRDESQALPVATVTVVDNGAGFNDENARAFFLSDSTRKVQRGNKGIGRFTWLKVFERAKIESTYLDGDQWQTRRFSFVRTPEGLEQDSVSEAEGESPITRVRLEEVRPEYQKHFPRMIETIARRIIDHLIIYFVSGTSPEIWLHDDGDGSSINLGEVFRREVREHAEDVRFTVGERQFIATILRDYSSAGRQHTISYCANGREVLEWKAASAIPDLKSRLLDEDSETFVFRTYVTGAYLDDRVNPDRTSFLFLQDKDLDFPGEVTRQELDAAVISALRPVAAPFIDVVRTEKRQTIERFVAEKAPQFRFVLKERYKEHLDQVAPNLPEDQLDIELYKVQRDIEIEHRQNAAKIQAAPLDALTHDGEYEELYARYLDEENELGKAALAKYVIHRRTILELLDRALKLRPDGAYEREDLVHGLIYPLRATSEEVDFEKQNLWVIDERLAYHVFLASDLPISRMKKVVHGEVPDEPDLIVFNAPSAFAESKPPFQSVVIIEFKRPERDDYSPKEENPVEQVLRYVQKIKAGKAKDKDGKTITVGSVPFYAYIICSLTPRIRTLAATMDFTRMSDNEGYFTFHKTEGCYIEIMSYDKVLSDAKRRNRAFFEHLQIPIP